MQGDPGRGWLRDIYLRYADDVYNVIRFRLRAYNLSCDADDLLQDVFLTAYEKRRALASSPDIRRWLFATANFKCKNYTRKMAAERRRILRDTDARRISERADPSAERALEIVFDETIDCGEVLGRVMDGMTEAERQLYRQAYMDRVSPEDLSSVYGISEAAMRMRVSRLRKRIVTGLKKVLYSTLLSILAHIL